MLLKNFLLSISAGVGRRRAARGAGGGGRGKLTCCQLMQGCQLMQDCRLMQGCQLMQVSEDGELRAVVAVVDEDNDELTVTHTHTHMHNHDHTHPRPLTNPPTHTHTHPHTHTRTVGVGRRRAERSAGGCRRGQRCAYCLGGAACPRPVRGAPTCSCQVFTHLLVHTETGKIRSCLQMILPESSNSDF